MSSCYLSSKAVAAHNVHRGESGFMGRTHSTSAVAIFLLGLAFFPALTNKLLGTDNGWVIAMAAVATAGASLLPDLDNTSSTARNSLGPLGHVVSELIRAASVFVQTFLRTSRDDPDPNPHRGAAHTLPAAALFGLGAYLLARMGGSVHLPVVGQVSWGEVFGVLIVFMLLHLALSGLAKPLLKDISKETFLGELFTLGLSLAVTVVMYSQVPEGQSLTWLGVAIFAGCAIHILGDCFTTAGAPILFPLSAVTKGKFWWMTRFTSIKAGGITESVVFVPIFLLAIAVSILKLLGVF